MATFKTVVADLKRLRDFKKDPSQSLIVMDRTVGEWRRYCQEQAESDGRYISKIIRDLESLIGA